MADELNRLAVRAILTDATYAVGLTKLDDGRENRDVALETIARSQQNYVDLKRRRNRLKMTDEEDSLFETQMDYLRASLRFFGGHL
jgi:hypothetical protein